MWLPWPNEKKMTMKLVQCILIQIFQYIVKFLLFSMLILIIFIMNFVRHSFFCVLLKIICFVVFGMQEILENGQSYFQPCRIYIYCKGLLASELSQQSIKLQVWLAWTSNILESPLTYFLDNNYFLTLLRQLQKTAIETAGYNRNIIPFQVNYCVMLTYVYIF